MPQKYGSGFIIMFILFLWCLYILSVQYRGLVLGLSPALHKQICKNAVVVHTLSVHLKPKKSLFALFSA